MIVAVTLTLFALLALSIPVGIVLYLLGFGVDVFFSAFPLTRGLGQVVWSSSSSATLIAIPLFVLLGEILVRGGVAERTYSALDKWVSWLPGGLIHANIGTATMFSATSGSSVATAATVATVAMPQAERLGYDPRLFSGAIAAGGTLGILIPPSINLIVYGFLTETSIPRLFLAGLLPGLLMALAFVVVTALLCAARPALGGQRRAFGWHERLGYDPRLFSGAIAAGGTLGILIPPSINLIVYGFLTETSIPRLFAAGLIPGILMAVAFMAVTAAICMVRPSLGGASRSFGWGERVRSLRALLPIVLLFVVVIGSIYTGLATPTESAAIGVAIAFVIAAAGGGVNVTMLRDSLTGAVRITAMITLVVSGAYFLNFTLASAGMGRELNEMLTGLQMGPMGTLLVVVALYIVLGFFIETLSLMVATIPIVVPVVADLGFDKVWFGVLLIVLIEMALITPPVGLNLYVVQGARRGGRMGEVMVGVIPFVGVMLAMVALLIVFPSIALYLPSQL